LRFAAETRLAEAIEKKGFDRGQPTIFVWEGVSDAVDIVLRCVAGCAAGTLLAFTFVHRGALDGSGRFADAARIVRNVAELGEP
jgi:O-methyltransferase involved in polyketide biosynthesis